ncbi:MAG: hypothetical protein FIA89_07945 [Geobacter sp.]|nr:hypothetical protein [Geobacter sp.]
MCTSGTTVLIAEAAALLATTETRVLMMLKKNELQGNQVDGDWFVDKASLQLCGKPKPSDFRKTGCGGGCGSGGGCGGH